MLVIARVACALLLLPACLGAQSSSTAALGPGSLIMIGSDAEDALRLRQLGGGSTNGWLLRSPASLRSASDRGIGGGGHIATDWRECARSAGVVPPSVDVVWSSRLPVARNDGALWTGRGYSARVNTGVASRCGRVHLQFIPELWYAENVTFFAAPTLGSGRSSFASPFHGIGSSSADLPQRFGAQSLLVAGLGESAISVNAGPVTAAITTESQWWGPGIRNALILSNHAAGIPRLELRTASPVRTRAGEIEARWIAGVLTESPYFDFDSANDQRSLSGLVLSMRTAFDSNLTIGGSRVVYAPIGSLAALPARSFDVFARWGPASNVRRATSGRGAEQLTELFARWVVPESHAEAYVEWARVILPSSLRSLLIAPQATQGFTLGTQWVSASDSAAGRWRAQVEFTQLEQDVLATTSAGFYTSPVVPQGYTQRGQVVGASIGPGSSSQWLAIDHLSQRWRLGVFGGHIRWDNDAYFAQPTSVNGFAHDVSVYGGVRAGGSVRAWYVSGELLSERRLNYLFQSYCDGYCIDDKFDVPNMSLRFSVSPRF